MSPRRSLMRMKPVRWRISQLKPRLNHLCGKLQIRSRARIRGREENTAAPATSMAWTWQNTHSGLLQNATWVGGWRGEVELLALRNEGEKPNWMMLQSTTGAPREGQINFRDDSLKINDPFEWMGREGNRTHNEIPGSSLAQSSPRKWSVCFGRVRTLWKGEMHRLLLFVAAAAATAAVVVISEGFQKNSKKKRPQKQIISLNSEYINFWTLFAVGSASILPYQSFLSK